MISQYSPPLRKIISLSSQLSMRNALTSIWLSNQRSVYQLSLTVPKWTIPPHFPWVMVPHVTSLMLQQNYLANLLRCLYQQNKECGNSKTWKGWPNYPKKIDDHPIRGEYKVWMWKNYLAPSLHFQLMVDLLKKESVRKIQQKATKFHKSWLNLPKCCTPASIFHPDVLNLPFLPHCQEAAKFL